MNQFCYIVLEFKGQFGYLLHEGFSKFQAERLYQNMAQDINWNLIDEIDDAQTIAEFYPIAEYTIDPKDSMLFISGCEVTYFPIADFNLMLIVSDKEIIDFSEVERHVGEATYVDFFEIKVLADDGTEDYEIIDFYLN